MRALSARALRDQRDAGEYDDVSTVFVKPVDGLSSRSNPSGSSTGSTVIFTLLMLGALVVGTVGLPQSSGSAGTANTRALGSFASFRTKLRSYATIKVTDDFKSGLNSWVSAGPALSQLKDWSYRDGFVRPGRLRLLKDSLGMTDYHIEFVGEVEQNGLTWVYRAKDARNFYAGKIVVSKPGPLPRADLVRYAVINGTEHARTSVALPVLARADALYKVQMSVKQSDFSTMVNGSMVDTWSDSRLPSGGVGFFSDKGEVATLRYVTITDRDTLVGRVLSYLGFLRPIGPLF
jgi:hypothetical protein